MQGYAGGNRAVVDLVPAIATTSDARALLDRIDARGHALVEAAHEAIFWCDLEMCSIERVRALTTEAFLSVAGGRLHARRH
ncbi:hypothetical protein [Frigidibacter sp. MR17.24]|uniref:hypothetical protein n=1 Tax=Frigidibacter sp. MR17.24 TaxID=3127345 RepID=UPI0030130289